jgi:hypothetical protein
VVGVFVDRVMSNPESRKAGKDCLEGVDEGPGRDFVVRKVYVLNGRWEYGQRERGIGGYCGNVVSFKV